MEWEDCPYVVSDAIEGGHGWLCGGLNACRLARVRNRGVCPPRLLRDRPSDGAVEGASAGELACSRQVSKKGGRGATASPFAFQIFCVTTPIPPQIPPLPSPHGEV